MSHRAVCTKIATVTCVALAMFLLSCQERHEYSSTSLEDAARAGEIVRGWLPDFLPKSSKQIQLAYAAESPRTWCTFEFSSADSRAFRKHIVPVDRLPAELRHISGPSTSWWPDFLTGKPDEKQIRNRGFCLYLFQEPDVGASKDLVLFAVDWSKGEAFFYRAPQPSQ